MTVLNLSNLQLWVTLWLMQIAYQLLPATCLISTATQLPKGSALHLFWHSIYTGYEKYQPSQVDGFWQQQQWHLPPLAWQRQFQTSNSKPVATPGDSSQPAATPPLTHHVYIGNQFFPAPSLPGWRMTIDLHLTVKPIANHIIMVEQLKLHLKPILHANWRFYA
jgi:hypothetical protein